MIGIKTIREAAVVALLVLAPALLPSTAEASPQTSQQASQEASRSAENLQTLTILTKDGRKTFTVETAATREQRDRGLMFRTHLAERHGMLFDFEQDQEVRMWMKNTLIPLDMVFIDADGRIHRIERDARPGSLDLIASEGPVRFVLELNAGEASRYGIAPGDRIMIGG
jgi:uncharacterized membrane protein (UPF0127 family)